MTLEERGRSSWLWMMHYIYELSQYNELDPYRMDFDYIKNSIHQYNQEWLSIQEQIKARGSGTKE